MALIKTSELSGKALDWAVAKAEGLKPITNLNVRYGFNQVDLHEYNPSTNWAQGGPIIEREKISIRDESHDQSGGWYAVKVSEDYIHAHVPFNTVQGWDGGGDTPLIAAMRCYVASKLGDEVDIPEALL